MRNLILWMLSMLLCCFVLSVRAQSAGKIGKVEEAAVALGDPFIMLYEDTYYAYGTASDDGIVVYTSDDLKHWSLKEQLALDKKDSWGDSWFWAPEVYYIPSKGKFFMYYSADEHICVASADSPLGPFVQQEKKPMLQGEKAIDNTLFIDRDGTPYLYWDRFNDGLNIWVAPLKDDLMTLDSASMRPCIRVSQTWETVWPRVNEGAFVYFHQGKYYMTYSANSYESPFYGLGYAVADSPMGPWKKYEGNPILQKPAGLVGVGHSALFTDKHGQLQLVFHAHQNQQRIHPRLMYIAPLHFKEHPSAGEDIMEVDTQAILRPVWVDKAL